MNKSQLRLLATEFANGQIPAQEYRARRRELIDDLVAGTVSIERVQPQHEPDSNDETTTLNGQGEMEEVLFARQAPATRRKLPLPLLLGAGSVLCAAIVAFLLWPQASEPPLVIPPPPTVPLTENIAPSRALVESFVARRDFGNDAIDSFRRDWQLLETAEREQARNELWFASLVRALRDEVKTQNALAGLAGGEAAIERAKAAFDLGVFLGVDDKLPAIDTVAASAVAAPASEVPPTVSATDSAAANPTPADTPIIASEAAVGSSPEASAPPSPASTPPTGQQWLAAQADEQLTLQIFAVNNLDRVEQLIAAHPALVVHVLETRSGAPRYRVFHGVFASEALARQAFAALPAEITKASHGAIVKSFSVVRDDLRAPASVRKPPPAAGPAEVFTLQVFATDNRASAQALVQSFPALKLQLHELPADAVPYRVIYGNYASADEARAANAALPQALLTRIGTPLPKPLSSLGEAAKP